MWNDTSNNRKITYAFVFILVIIFSFFQFNPNCFKLTFAETTSETMSDEDDITEELNENITDILNDIDSDELDDYLLNDFDLDFFNTSSFKELVIKILNGTYFDEYDSIFEGIFDYIKQNLKSLFSVFLTLLSIVILFELFKNLSSDKYEDLNKAVKIIFSLVIVFILISLLSDIAEVISSAIQTIFSFSSILFPILLNLVLLSGASGTYSVYSSLSVFLLETGSYIFVYVLFPLSVSILLLTLFGSAFQNKRFSRIIDILKSIFKWIIGIFALVFGLFSAVNVVSSGISDGVSLKLTKFAVKNYIPFLGGYLSDGFDFVHSCAVLVKNSFGICGIIVLFLIILKPIVSYLVYLFLFKILSLVALFVGNEHYSDMFLNVSKCMSLFITVLIGLFLIFFIFVYLLILSVSIV